MRLALDPDAANMLQTLAGSQRKQGEYVSRLIRAAAAGALDMDRAALVEKVASLEQQFAALGRELAQVRSDLQKPRD